MRKLRKNHSSFENSVESYLCRCGCNCTCTCTCGYLSGVSRETGISNAFTFTANNTHTRVLAFVSNTPM